jgi:glycopeptide antibiotics resistance protein
MTWFKNFRYVILWSALILALSLFPGRYLPRIPDFYELLKPAKIAHLVLFTVFSILLLQSILKQYGYAFFRFYGIIIALLIGISFGAITEYLQFVLKINRSGNIYDFITNTLGCLLGLLAFLIIRRKKLKKANAN